MTEREQIEDFVAALLAALNKGYVGGLSCSDTTSTSGEGNERKIHRSFTLSCEVSAEKVK